LDIIGFFWIFLISSPVNPCPKHFDTPGSSPEIKYNWSYLDFPHQISGDLPAINNGDLGPLHSSP
jgi:hypothetical protein